MRITIRDLQNKVPVDSRKVIKTVQKVLLSEGIKKLGEITVCFVNDRKIKKLNLKYLGKNSPTDVIAFDIAEPKRQDKIFADIVISTDRAIDNAAMLCTTPLFELYLYVIHGVLHILGYDDRTQKQKKIMHEKACHILKTIIRKP